MRTPARWYGAKGWLVKHLLPLPDHYTYVEVFGGAATILFAKEPSPVEIYNDIDGGLVNFYRVLQDKYGFEDDGKLLFDMLRLTPHSREEYMFCRAHWNDKGIDEVEKARRFFVVMHQSFSGGTTAGWRFCKTDSSMGMSAATNRWLSAIDRLPEAIDRLRLVQIDGEDFTKSIKRYDNPKTLFYLDPPYIHSKRVDTKSYRNEMDDPAHKRLVEALLPIEGMAILSGYDHEIYEPLARAGWRKRLISRANMAARVKKGQKRDKEVEECVWFSPSYPKEAIRVET